MIEKYTLKMHRNNWVYCICQNVIEYGGMFTRVMNQFAHVHAPL